MLKSRRSLSSLSVPTGAILCGWFILQLRPWARGPGWVPQAWRRPCVVGQGVGHREGHRHTHTHGEIGGEKGFECGQGGQLGRRGAV